jgi:hypothetical protein
MHHGTYEEDGLVTWEVLVFPREIRSHGEPVNHLRNWRVHRRTRRPPSIAWQNKRLSRGRPMARGTGATAEGGEGVGGSNMSFDVGELAGNSDPAEQRGPVLM